MSPCPRCGAAHEGPRWCPACELEFDGWQRQYASDIIAPALGGVVVVISCAMVLPWAGASVLVALGAAFGGFGVLAGLARLRKLARRRQFLRGPLPRATLASGEPGSPSPPGSPGPPTA